MLVISILLSVFFIFLICMICKAYHDDIIELENRMLQLEKRIENLKKVVMYKPICCDIDKRKKSGK